MTRTIPASLATALLLSACSLSPPAVESGTGISSQTGQFEFALPSGDYRCEQGVRLALRREMQDRVNHRVQLDWNGRHYQLDRDPSHSGLPRFEDTASGLVWIDLPWKGLLLDGRTQAPLANECRAT